MSSASSCCSPRYSGISPMVIVSGTTVSMRFALLVLCAFLLSSGIAHAHGVVTRTEIQRVIFVEAIYEDGTPMAGAQVVVFSPQNPRTPWLTTVADEQGHVRVTPDQQISGTWSIQLRQAGHGAMIHVDLGDEDITITSRTETGRLRTLLMFGLVVWGAVGTALYFRKGKKSHAYS
ncbi:hypothetical protein Selin_1225 [Desulfurispirillum indicum S5]|uniref:Carboxypeptidase regulatory-like domain-containing protein n=1 Tax=Desulfurispirillum indicum (strain ATCC BAA-1389 / DSM 22839 / S5) TaxID=653733 RepID=E6W4Y4_DESIS|nr:hypothetical protein Selin_1225 [Desulfurispirillum indicum S5]